jgi:hypothetical protein
MSTGAWIAVVVGVVAVIFLAVNRGLVQSGVQVGVGPGGVTTTRGIVAPQPTANYGGYLAASTAPGVSNALNGALTGLGHALAGWMNPPAAASAPVAQGASASSPSLYAQPSGPALALGGTAVAGALVGPQIDPTIQYDLTSGAAFDYSGLTQDNSFDPSASLSYA